MNNNANIYLNSVAKICQKELDALNIPYAKDITFSVNTRAKSRWGQCKHNKVTDTYSINIAEVLCDPANVKGLKNTIIHELLHSTPNGMSHTGEWKRYAAMVNRHYGYNIKRCSSSDEKGCELPKAPKEYKYIFQCEYCGHIYKRQRKPKWYDRIEQVTCGGCGGHLHEVGQDEVILSIK